MLLLKRTYTNTVTYTNQATLTVTLEAFYEIRALVQFGVCIVYSNDYYIEKHFIFECSTLLMYSIASRSHMKGLYVYVEDENNKYGTNSDEKQQTWIDTKPSHSHAGVLCSQPIRRQGQGVKCVGGGDKQRRKTALTGRGETKRRRSNRSISLLSCIRVQLSREDLVFFSSLHFFKQAYTISKPPCRSAGMG